MSSVPSPDALLARPSRTTGLPSPRPPPRSARHAVRPRAPPLPPPRPPTRAGPPSCFTAQPAPA
eukprot:5901948-Pleurochrysis_carterae.AAC.1